MKQQEYIDCNEKIPGKQRSDKPKVIDQDNDGRWFFWNETYSDRIGSFNNREEAQIALSKYCEEHLKEKIKNQKIAKYKEYKETHFQGSISIENKDIILKDNIIDGDIGIQISGDGRIWVCINHIAFIRFKPKRS